MPNDFSVTQYARRLTTSSTPTFYVLRVLQTRGLSNAVLEQVYHHSPDVRRHCVAWSHQGTRSPAHQLGDRTRPGVKDTIHQISQRLTNCVTLKMTNCFTKPSGSQITCCTHRCRYHPLRRNATISDSAISRYSCRNTPHTYQTLGRLVARCFVFCV